jgi:Uma2 family endonuclease
MNAIAQQLPALLSRGEFLSFLERRAQHERWQLIDGVAVMMNPPTVRHQRIAMNLAMELNIALRRDDRNLVALVEVGLSLPGNPSFLPIADLAVVDEAADDSSYANRFCLAAEVLSASNTREFIARKLRRYAEHPDNLHFLVFSQRKMRVEVFSCQSDWKSVVLRTPDAVLELPEFGFRCQLRDLYRGTPLA